jgi:hypothetical protein
MPLGGAAMGWQGADEHHRTLSAERLLLKVKRTSLQIDP